MRTRILTIMALTALVASCGKRGGLSGSCPFHWLPPTKYDHEPLSLPVMLVLGLWDIDAECRKPTGYIKAQEKDGRRITGCARYINPPYLVSEIVIPKVSDKDGIDQHCQDLGVRHEEGHLNGWPANHAGGVSAS